MLINCSAYQDGAKIADCPIDDISSFVDRPNCFVWVALKDATDAELAKMQEEFGLHDLAIADAKSGHQRPKIEEYGSTVFAVLQTIELSPLDELVVGELDLFVGPNFVAVRRTRADLVRLLGPPSARIAPR